MQAFHNIPNRTSLLAGLALSVGFLFYLVFNVGYDLAIPLITVAPGLPVAFLFLMFNNPKEKPDFDLGTVLAFPICAMMWPIIVFALLVGRPWKDPKWVNREGPSPLNWTGSSNYPRHRSL